MEEEVESERPERLCQAVSPNDEPCDYPATVHCAKYGRWFCDAHAETEQHGAIFQACMTRIARFRHQNVI
jgi:hypothetical protein